MDLDQLLDPTRLASIWNAATRRAPSRAGDPDRQAPLAPARYHDQGLRDDRGLGDDQGPAEIDPSAATVTVVPRPDGRASFLALRGQVAALFAEGTEARRIVDDRLAAMDGALQGAGLVSAQDLDDLEDLLEAFLVARNWAPVAGGGT